ncbi:hypothetical protein BTA51_20130 [Hahella sp. CCB-MM4]|uniref:carotenoid oxygenase family protein n=1 Tax=Hahella sp. (strain CCB-MM4) TaxID=1926491 RepID=UPI000B9B5C63|nr:carotenoid oxygenase family protein [Hahella sp. CCB-MM4]OZG71591.1 hypothetical protein BTA51_20130 [Hahella sp. CCB-MM4]
MTVAATNPFLNGVFKAQHEEILLTGLDVSGEIPRELNGCFLRNGPNPQFVWSDNYHMYSGDGMLHALSLVDGRASYLNRFIRTPRFMCEKEQGRAVFPGMRDALAVDPAFGHVPPFTANTHVLKHAGRLLALNEGSMPFVVTNPATGEGTLDNFGGTVKMTFTAHPKLDPRTGELHGFSYITPNGMIDYLMLNPAGVAKSIASFRPPYRALMHDFAITQHYAVFPIYPLTWSMERVQRGERLYKWEPELGSYYYVLDRNNGEVVRVFRDSATLGMHTVNAYEKQGRIILDMVMMDDLPEGARAFEDDSITYLNSLNRVTLDLESGTLQRERLSHLNVEFPRIDERWSAAPYRYCYLASTVNDRLPQYLFDSLSRFDHRTGQMETYRPEHDVLFGEPVFVPVGEHEGEGYLLSYGYDQDHDKSDLWILDAMNIADGPVARIHIPQRVPYGFHGSWINDWSPDFA